MFKTNARSKKKEQCTSVDKWPLITSIGAGRWCRGVEVARTQHRSPSTKGWLPGKNVGPEPPTCWIFKRMLKYGSLQERSQFFKCYAFFFLSHTGEPSWWPSGLDSELQSLVGKLRSHMLCSVTKKF